MNNKSIVFSDTMEKNFLTLAINEGVFHIPESHKYLNSW